jgi:RNA polymerase sigma factor (sigma-70 family)
MDSESFRPFSATHWSLVLAAGTDSSPGAQQALDRLCHRYWPPLYAFVRRCGYPPCDAQDLTQGFFLQLLHKNHLEAVDPRKGKFRSFLLASLKHYLSNERDRARAQKRGGGALPISIDEQDAEGRYLREPADVMTPERLYERRWALTVLEQALARLREEYAAAHRADLFDALKDRLAGNDQGPAHADTARRLDMTPGAVKVAAHRLRKRYREILREEIACTVSSPEEIEEEIRHLFRTLAAPEPFSP